MQLVLGGAELAGRFGKREDEDAAGCGRQSDAPAGLQVPLPANQCWGSAAAAVARP